MNSHYECVRGCGRRYSIFDVVYRCEDCGGLLEVVHDLEPLRARSGAEWRALFEARARSTAWFNGSGVWARKEWVCPQVAAENVVTTGEGNTPLLAAPALGDALGIPDLWLKLCGNSHTGSFKDLGMTVLVSVVKQMIANGVEWVETTGMFETNTKGITTWKNYEHIQHMRRRCFVKELR